MSCQKQKPRLQLVRVKRLIFTCDVQFLSIFPSIFLFFASVEEEDMHGLFGTVVAGGNSGALV